MATRGLTDSTQRVSFYDDVINPSHQNNLWRDCPLLEYQHDPSIGIYLNETWGSYNAQATTGDYILTQATAGSAAMSTAISGALAINAGLQRLQHAGRERPTLQVGFRSGGRQGHVV
jgi:hypothetical protein